MFREGCGGQYGFVSSHAANAFALLTFFWLRYRKKVKEEKTLSNLLILFMAVWAVAMCYSRVYLGKHYLGDILCGAIFGVLVGWIVYWGSKMVEKKIQNNVTK